MSYPEDPSREVNLNQIDEYLKTHSQRDSNPSAISLIFCSEARRKLVRKLNQRPIRNKWPVVMAIQVAAMQKSSIAIEKMTEASRRRAKFAEEIATVDFQKLMISLLSMFDVNPELRKIFAKLSQIKAIKESEKSVGLQEHDCEYAQTTMKFNSSGEVTTSIQRSHLPESQQMWHFRGKNLNFKYDTSTTSCYLTVFAFHIRGQKKLCTILHLVGSLYSID